jgi:hypothetical protein
MDVKTGDLYHFSSEAERLEAEAKGLQLVDVSPAEAKLLELMQPHERQAWGVKRLLAMREKANRKERRRARNHKQRERRAKAKAVRRARRRGRGK